MRPVVVAVAITGSVPRKSDNPTLPITPAEQIRSTQAAYAAGASLVHIHVRNPDETPSSDPSLFAQVKAGVEQHCPGMIVEFSTGGRGRDPAARGLSLTLRPDMASLSTGSVNFPTIVYENPAPLVSELAGSMKANGVRPEIEVFDLSHLHGALRLVEAGLMDDRPHVQFVMGVKNAIPAEVRILDILLAEMRHVLPNATWTAAGIGRHQSQVMGWALERGADGVRTGLEDNIRISKTRLAEGNAEACARGCRPMPAAWGQTGAAGCRRKRCSVYREPGLRACTWTQAWLGPKRFLHSAVTVKIAVSLGVRHDQRADEGDAEHDRDVPEEGALRAELLQLQRHRLGGAAEQRVGDRVGQADAERPHLGREQLRFHDAADARVEADHGQADHDQPEGQVRVLRRRRWRSSTAPPSGCRGRYRAACWPCGRSGPRASRRTAG